METRQTSGSQETQIGFRPYLLVLICCFISVSGFAQEKTGSPFFYVKSKEKKVDVMPLKRTAVDVNVAGVIADVKVTQEYQNEGDQTLEAIYVFPASTNAAVYGFEMTVGSRKIVAKIAEKQKARQQYEAAKKEGKTASLLEQKRPNVFQMSVGNILPNDYIKVELFYTETLIPTDGVYEFIYPTVVGPRYAEEFATEVMFNDDWVKSPYQKDGEEPSYDYEINATVNAGMPIKKVVCNTHKVNVSHADKSTVTAKLDPSDKKGGNRDYVLKYELAGGKIQSGLLLHEGQEENFFMAMVQPPAAVNMENMPPREYIFILDVSGSMRGFPLDVSKGLLEKLVGSLRPEDRFNVMLFESGNEMLASESLPANKQNLRKAMAVIDKLRGGGSTDILGALKSALAMKETKNYSRSFVVVTDGYITVEQEAFALIRKNLGQANLYAIGIGSSVNRFLIEGLARAGMGEPLVVLDQKDANEKVERFRQYISSPVLTNIDMKFEGLEVYDVEPISYPDVLAQRPVVIYGKYKNAAKGKITLTGLTGNRKNYTETLDVATVKPSASNQALRYLWARNRIKVMDDFNSLQASTEQVEQITKMGLKYNLLTNYTSFIAVDPTKRDSKGNLLTVKQALPMPKGVSNKGQSYNALAKTGSVERSVPTSKKAIASHFYKKQPAFASKISLAWRVDEKRLGANNTYKVSIKNLIGDKILEQKTTEKVLDIDLTDPKYKSIQGGAFMYSIEVLGKHKKSDEYVIQLLGRGEALAVTNEAGSLLLAKTIEDKKNLAKFFEEKGLLANALAVWREIIQEDSSETIKASYEEFIKRNR
ncbi:MAG: VIT and vWA domain-containing protein, partial [Flammeovirgaceae bacterium]